MKIILGKTAGFCTGVQNSINKTNELLSKYDNLYCLGHLVHNDYVVNGLKDKGLNFIDNFDNLNNEKVIIRAHGIPNYLYDEANNKKLELFDLSCPKVIKIHKLAEKLKDDYYIILVGQHDHPEIIGTISYCGNNSTIIEKINDLDNLEINHEKIAVIVQTTYSEEKFHDIEAIIKEKYQDREVVIYNTICNATRIRQDEVKELSKRVDYMIIVGSKNSSNTTKLYELAQENTKTSLVESVNDLDKEIFNYETIGIMGGASTPKELINEIINYLEINS